MSKKSLLITLSTIILLPVMLLILSLIILSNTDFSQHRDAIAEHVSKVAGRKLSLNGEFKLDLAATTSLVITDIALSNAAWVAEPEMLTVQRIEAKVELLPLLLGNIRMPHFLLEGVNVLLETNSSGLNNWMLAEEADVESDADEGNTMEEFKLPWIGDMFISNVVLSYHDGQSGNIIISKLEHARISSADKKSPTVIDILGQINKHPFEITGKVASPTNLTGQGAEAPIEVDASILDFKAKVTGAITGSTNAPVADLKLQANAKNLNQLRLVFGKTVPVISNINFHAKLNSANSKLKLSTMVLELDNGRIDGWVTLDTATAKPDLQAELTFSGLDLDKLLLAQGKPVEATTKPVNPPEIEKLFSEEPLPFDKLHLANAKITLKAKNLLKNKKRLKEAEIFLRLDEGKFTASLLKLSSVRGEIEGSLVVDVSGMGAPSMMLKLVAPQLELGELILTSGGMAVVEAPLATEIYLQSQGHNLAQIMGSLDGNIKLLMKQGSADAKSLDMFVGGFSAMVGTIFIDQSSKTKINCAICDLKIENGVVTPRLAVLDTQYSTVFADGQVDLKKEQLNIKVSPLAKGVTLSVAFPVHVQGTLTSPEVKIEKSGALLKVSQLWANIVYPPSLLVNFANFGDGKQNPCVSMIVEKSGMPISGGAVKDAGSGIGQIIDANEETNSKLPAENNVDDDI